MGNEALDGLAAHGNILRVHGMFADGCTLDGLKGTCPDVQRHLLPLNAAGIDVLQHTLREVQSCGRSRYAALDFGIYRLIGRLVALLRSTVQVWRYGQFTNGINHLGKAASARPLKLNELTRTHFTLAYSLNRQRSMLKGQCPFFPFLQVAN